MMGAEYIKTSKKFYVMPLRPVLNLQVSVGKHMDMANTLMFDTLKYSKRLVEAGFTPTQAKALAEE